MKKRISLVITLIFFTLNPIHLSANFVKDTSYKDDYSWDLTDSDQKKVAAGMIMWGFFLIVASALLSGFIPNSTLPATSTTTSS